MSLLSLLVAVHLLLCEGRKESEHAGDARWINSGQLGQQRTGNSCRHGNGDRLATDRLAADTLIEDGLGAKGIISGANS